MSSLITIITPCFNGALFATQYVHMLRAQTFQEWMAIIVDDHSTDQSYALLHSLVAGDPRFLLHHNIPPLSPGPSSARNYAISVSDSPYIAFCDIDDIWHPTKLSAQYHFHISNQLDLSVTSYARFTRSKPFIIRSIRHPPVHLNYNTLLSGNPIPLSSVLISRSLLASHLFLPIKHEDYDLWLTLFRSFPALRYGSLRDILMYYRVHEDSLSSNKILMPAWVLSVFRKQGYSLPSSFFLVTRWCILRLFTYFMDITHPFRGTPADFTPRI